MANDSLDSDTDVGDKPCQFTPGNSVVDIAQMLVAMNHAGRLTAAERVMLCTHANNEVGSLPMRIRGVAVVVMNVINDGNFERAHIANAVWSIDLMADALEGMHMLASELRSPAETLTHG